MLLLKHNLLCFSGNLKKKARTLLPAPTTNLSVVIPISFQYDISYYALMFNRLNKQRFFLNISIWFKFICISTIVSKYLDI